MTKESKHLTFKHYHLVPLGNWLQGLELPGRKSRARNRFITNILTPRIKEIEDTRIGMLGKYSNKDKDGKPLMKKMPDGSTGDVFDLKDQEGFRKEFNEYQEEEFIIDVTKSNEQDINIVKDLVLNTDEKFKDVPGNMMATLYSQWCDVLEKL